MLTCVYFSNLCLHVATCMSLWKSTFVQFCKIQRLHHCIQTLTLELTIDHFHKWWPIINSFASIKISLTDLILKLIIQKKF